MTGKQSIMRFGHEIPKKRELGKREGKGSGKFSLKSG